MGVGAPFFSIPVIVVRLGFLSMVIFASFTTEFLLVLPYEFRHSSSSSGLMLYDGTRAPLLV